MCLEPKRCNTLFKSNVRRKGWRKRGGEGKEEVENSSTVQIFLQIKVQELGVYTGFLSGVTTFTELFIELLFLLFHLPDIRYQASGISCK